MTLFWPKLKGPQDLASFGVVAVFNKPYDKAQLEGGLGKVAEGGTKPRVLTPTDRMAVMLVGLDAETYGKPQTAKDGPHSAAIREAATRKHILTLSAAPGQFPDEIRGDNLPQEVRPFLPLLTAETVSAFISLDKELTVDIRVKSSTPPRAKEVEKSLGFLATMAGEFIGEGMKKLRKDAVTDTDARSLIAMLASLQTGLKEAKFTTEGESTRAVAKVSADLPLAQSFLAAKRKVQQAAATASSQNNLKQIVLALHNYHDAMGAFPPAAVVDKKGKPMLSWRVLILPYVEEEALYKQFKLDEPWDSENNKKLIEKMPRVYAMPAAAKPKPETHYRLFVGNGAGFDYLKGFRLTDYTDGTSNTIAVITAKDSVIWSKPDELDFDPEKIDATKLLGFMPGDACPVAFADGSVRNLSPKVSKATLHAMITRGGGEVISDDE